MMGSRTALVSFDKMKRTVGSDVIAARGGCDAAIDIGFPSRDLVERTCFARADKVIVTGRSQWTDPPSIRLE